MNKNFFIKILLFLFRFSFDEGYDEWDGIVEGDKRPTQEQAEIASDVSNKV